MYLLEHRSTKLVVRAVQGLLQTDYFFTGQWQMIWLTAVMQYRSSNTITAHNGKPSHLIIPVNPIQGSRATCQGDFPQH